MPIPGLRAIALAYVAMPRPKGRMATKVAFCKKATLVLASSDANPWAKPKVELHYFILLKYKWTISWSTEQTL
jgi:hypothetical protein